jgi:hypothetical protein
MNLRKFAKANGLELLVDEFRDRGGTWKWSARFRNAGIECGACIKHIFATGRTAEEAEYLFAGKISGETLVKFGGGSNYAIDVPYLKCTMPDIAEARVIFAEDPSRVAACVRAMNGIDDPEEFVKTAKEAMRAVKEGLFVNTDWKELADRCKRFIKEDGE